MKNIRALSVVSGGLAVLLVAGAVAASLPTVSAQPRAATIPVIVARAEATIAPADKLPRSSSTANPRATSTIIKAVDKRNSLMTMTRSGEQVVTVLFGGSVARFQLDLPAGDTVRSLGWDGAYAVFDRSGKPIGEFNTPWAVDASGKHLKTFYQFQGNEIIQHVNTSHARYPITVDPYFKWYWNGVVITLSPGDMRAIAVGGLEVLTPFLLASGFGWSVVGAVGWAAGYAGWEIQNNQCQYFWVPYWKPWDSSWGTYSC